MQVKSICGSIFVILAAISFIQVAPAAAQLVPEPWVTVGGKDGSVTYGAGVKIFDLGAEIGRGPNSVSGVDILKFFSFPAVSPYVGLGIYGDRGVAYSGGVHLSPPGNIFFGLGYHSIRGVNGNVGFKF
jgi:hypothetical protein